MLFRKFIATFVAFCLAGTTVLVPTQATAMRTCADPNAVGANGLLCATQKTTSGDVHYPKLQWTELSAQDVSLSTSGFRFDTPTGSETDRLNNLAAQALDGALAPQDLAAAVALFPTNTPFVLGRYNPMTNELAVDIFKLQKSMQPGGARVRMLHARFAPEHGEHWEAHGAYIDPASHQRGERGLNPFAHYGTNDTFENITLAGAQVAVGHAMRMVQAPFAALATFTPNIRTEKKTKKSLFKKKVTYIWHGEATPVWYLAMPSHLAKETPTASQPFVCARDPSATECPWYEAASAGVTFDTFEGGTLSSTMDTWELKRKTQSGFTFLAMVVVGVVFSAALIAAAPAIGAMGGAASGAMSGGAVTAGIFTYASAAAGTMFATSVVSAVAMEVAFWSAVGFLAGGNLGSTYSYPGPFNLTSSKGLAPSASLDELNGKLVDKIAQNASLDSQPGASSWNTLTGIRATVQGSCAFGNTLAQCGASASGIVQRSDQLLEFDSGRFLRDNGGQVLRTTPQFGEQ
jgi:type II secretory pathway pseudopilin PulG